MKIDYLESDYNIGHPLIDEGKVCLAGDIVEERRVKAIDVMYVMWFDYKVLFT